MSDSRKKYEELKERYFTPEEESFCGENIKEEEPILQRIKKLEKELDRQEKLIDSLKNLLGV